jgi:hypothetical protein
MPMLCSTGGAGIAAELALAKNSPTLARAADTRIVFCIFLILFTIRFYS